MSEFGRRADWNEGRRGPRIDLDERGAISVFPQNPVTRRIRPLPSTRLAFAQESPERRQIGKDYVIIKAIPAGDAGNPGSFVIPVGQVCKVVRRAAAADMVVVNCPEGYHEIGLITGVEGVINASDLKEAK